MNHRKASMARKNFPEAWREITSYAYAFSYATKYWLPSMPQSWGSDTNTRSEKALRRMHHISLLPLPPHFFPLPVARLFTKPTRFSITPSNASFSLSASSFLNNQYSSTLLASPFKISNVNT